MKRRVFLQTSLFALAAPGLGAVGAAADSIGTDMVFYDARFAEARAFASGLGAPSLTPVDGDVTEVWTAKLNKLSKARPLSLSGVTTESFYFCLKTLLQSRAQVDARIERMTKDLYAWSVRTSLTGKTG